MRLRAEVSCRETRLQALPHGRYLRTLGCCNGLLCSEKLEGRVPTMRHRFTDQTLYRSEYQPWLARWDVLFPRFSLLRTNRHRAELEAFTFSTLPQRDLKMQTWGPSCCSASGLEALWAQPSLPAPPLCLFRFLVLAGAWSAPTSLPASLPASASLPLSDATPPWPQGPVPRCPLSKHHGGGAPPHPTPKTLQKISKQGSRILGRATHCVCMPRPGAHPRLRAPPHLPHRALPSPEGQSHSRDDSRSP